MDDYKTTYGLRWLPQHFKRYPNAYYNYKKQRKAGYDAQKKQKQKLIRKAYHAYAGRPGCPYDNAPMESFYGKFKAELIEKYSFKNDEHLNQVTLDYVYRYYIT